MLQLSTTSANEIDGKLSDALRDFLFGRDMGEDLAGRNIFRGRELGVPTYGGVAQCFGTPVDTTVCHRPQPPSHPSPAPCPHLGTSVCTVSAPMHESSRRLSTPLRTRAPTPATCPHSITTIHAESELPCGESHTATFAASSSLAMALSVNQSCVHTLLTFAFTCGVTAAR